MGLFDYFKSRNRPSKDERAKNRNARAKQEKDANDLSQRMATAQQNRDALNKMREKLDELNREIAQIDDSLHRIFNPRSAEDYAETHRATELAQQLGTLKRTRTDVMDEIKRREQGVPQKTSE
jgi:uncharacterized phage infection (PIP) family protein YhgE